MLEIKLDYMEQKKNNQMLQQVLPIYSNYELPDVRRVPSRGVGHFFLCRTEMFPRKVLASENCSLCVLA